MYVSKMNKAAGLMNIKGVISDVVRKMVYKGSIVGLVVSKGVNKWKIKQTAVPRRSRKEKMI